MCLVCLGLVFSLGFGCVLFIVCSVDFSQFGFCCCYFFVFCCSLVLFGFGWFVNTSSAAGTHFLTHSHVALCSFAGHPLSIVVNFSKTKCFIESQARKQTSEMV